MNASATVEYLAMSSSLYYPLDKSTNEIRLLRILAEPHALGFDSAINCELRAVSLETHPRYEALSYVWGPDDSDERILVNGVPIAVRYNLLQALLILRRRVISRSSGQAERTQEFWIDALCINQDNLSERGRQVGIMGEIYRCSVRVLVWLGTGDANMTSYPEAVIPTKGMLASDYWTRLWIIQEICLAPRVELLYCDLSCTWNVFSRAIPWTEADEFVRHKLCCFDGIMRSNLALNDARPERRLLRSLLVLSQSSLCRDPRDKLYGILGLASDVLDGDILADYTISLFDIFCQVVQEFREPNPYTVRRNTPDNIVALCRALQESFLGHGEPLPIKG